MKIIQLALLSFAAVTCASVIENNGVSNEVQTAVNEMLEELIETAIAGPTANQAEEEVVPEATGLSLELPKEDEDVVIGECGSSNESDLSKACTELIDVAHKFAENAKALKEKKALQRVQPNNMILLNLVSMLVVILSIFIAILMRQP